jgi:hypothetical protein
MKSINYFLILLLLVVSGCKDISVATPEFDVSTDALSYKVNEEITFNFHGNADNISFYSGESGNDYSYKNGRMLNVNQLLLSFNSRVQNGTQDMLTVNVSTDFNGDYSNIESVNKATWVDITNKLALGTTTTFAPSGYADISDLAIEGKPLYIGFKYTYKNPDVYGASRIWRIQQINLLAKTDDYDALLLDMQKGGIRIVDKYPPPHIAATRTTITSGTSAQLTFNTAVSTADNKMIETEAWGISDPLMTKTIDMGPDKSIPVKAKFSGNVSSYSYAYKKAGVYKIHFLASNNNYQESKDILKTLTITITEE